MAGNIVPESVSLYGVASVHILARRFGGSANRAIVVAAVIATLSLCFAPEALSQPSFNCATNRAPDEVTICGNIALSQLDRQLGDLYGAVREGLDLNQQQGLRDVQRNWLRQRTACGSDASCIARLYQQRISQLRTILAGPPAPVTPPAPVGARPPPPGGNSRDACDAFPTLC